VTGWRLSGLAERQMAEVLAKSANDHGQRHASHYQALLLVAMADVAADYKRLGARRVSRLPNIWVYELWHSRNHVPGTRRIRDPWHKIVYRLLPDDMVEILAVVGRSYPTGRAAREAMAGP
jgi:plasmid stabilization system protein ParE